MSHNQEGMDTLEIIDKWTHILISYYLNYLFFLDYFISISILFFLSRSFYALSRYAFLFSPNPFQSKVKFNLLLGMESYYLKYSVFWNKRWARGGGVVYYLRTGWVALELESLQVRHSLQNFNLLGEISVIHIFRHFNIRISLLLYTKVWIEFNE